MITLQNKNRLSVNIPHFPIKENSLNIKYSCSVDGALQTLAVNEWNFTEMMHETARTNTPILKNKLFVCFLIECIFTSRKRSLFSLRVVSAETGLFSW